MFAGAAAIVLSVGLTLLGCPAAHEGYPGKACKANSDCFEDEVCNVTTMTCEAPPVDMAVPDDFPRPDFTVNQDLIGADLTGEDLSEAPDMTEVDL